MVEPCGVDRAERQAGATGAAGAGQYLAFRLGGETFAIPIRSVREVLPYGGLTQVPLMPACIRGVLNLRGSVVPVVDLAVRFGRDATPVAPRTCVVILELERDEVVLGILVDQVKAVLDIAGTDIEPAPPFGSALRQDFLAGVAKADGRFVILLDVDQLLAIEDLAALADPVPDPAG